MLWEVDAQVCACNNDENLQILIHLLSSREGFATVPNVTFEDVGALDDIREELEMAVCAPVNYPEVVASLGTHQHLNKIMYRVTSHLDSYILLTSVLEVP